MNNYSKLPFSEMLLKWFAKNARKMPWRKLTGIPNPYKIWVSEMMLQQTTVSTVAGYFVRWMKAFPSMKALAKADETAILKVWQGLGYYARPKNMHKCAKILVLKNKGNLPETYDELLTFPGIGPYTAAAVASIAFNQAVPLVDANVRRVMMRILNINDVASSKQDAIILNQLRIWISPKKPGHFNQALMELGSQICKSQNPVCNQCPVSHFCKAYDLGIQEIIPVKKIKKITVIAAVIGIIEYKGKVLIQKRPEKGLLAGLWEFPGGKIEPGDANNKQALIREIHEETGLEVEPVTDLGSISHAYTEFRVNLSAYICQVVQKPPHLPKSAFWVAKNSLKDFPMPSGSARILERYLATK